jgi:hypothetical protein
MEMSPAPSFLFLFFILASFETKIENTHNLLTTEHAPKPNKSKKTILHLSHSTEVLKTSSAKERKDIGKKWVYQIPPEAQIRLERDSLFN